MAESNKTQWLSWSKRLCSDAYKADDPNYVIDWSKFATTDRTKLQDEAMGHATEDEFDTTIYGPWMRRWEIVHHNKHTKAHDDHINNPWWVASSWHA